MVSPPECIHSTVDSNAAGKQHATMTCMQHVLPLFTQQPVVGSIGQQYLSSVANPLLYWCVRSQTATS
jgi:hypothetical protein